MAWNLSEVLLTARNDAARIAANACTITQADAGVGNSCLKLYTALDDTTQERTHLAALVLAKPCGTLVNGRIQLLQASAAGDIVLKSGVPTYAQWLDGNGEVIATCSVSSESGDGELKVSSRSDGMVFAGGYITLQPGLIG